MVNTRFLTEWLLGRRFPLEREKITQDQIAAALIKSNVPFSREVAVMGGVIDFTLTSPCFYAHHIGLEIKLRQTSAQVRRQVTAYLTDPRIDAVVVACARPLSLPAEIGGKPLVVFDLSMAWL